MRLIDLLKTAKETQGVIVRDDWDLGIIYSMRFNCFIWCDKDGKAIEDTTDVTGFKRVLLSTKLLEEEKWCLTPDKFERIERFKELHNKTKKKNYIENRLEETVNKCNINDALEEFFKLGSANAYGYIMYALDKDFDKKDIKKIIMDSYKGDTQFRCDVFGVWGDLDSKI